MSGDTRDPGRVRLCAVARSEGDNKTSTGALRALADALDALDRAIPEMTQGFAYDHCCNAIREIKKAIHVEVGVLTNDSEAAEGATTDRARDKLIAAAKAFALHLDLWDKIRFQTEHGPVFLTISRQDPHPDSFDELS